MNAPDPKANTTTEAYLAYKAGYLEESELKPKLYEPYLHFDAWLAYWAGLTTDYPVSASEINIAPIDTSTRSSLGVTAVSDSASGKVVLNGNAESTAAQTLYVDRTIEIKAGETYTLSANNPAVNSGVSLRLYAGGTTYIADLQLSSENATITFTANGDYTCRLQWRVTTGTTADSVIMYPMLEVGYSASPFQPHFAPEMLTDEEALVAYLSGVTDTYPEDIKDPYDVRIVGYLKHLASIRWPEPDYPVNNEEFYLSTMEPTHTSNSEPSADIELDTAEGKVLSVEAYGDTYQQTYSGKNLLDIPDGYTGTSGGVTTTWSNNIATSNATSATSTTCTLTSTLAFKSTTLPAGTYTFSVQSSTSQYYPILRLRDTSDTWHNYSITAGEKSVTITTDYSANAAQLSLGLWTAGTSITNFVTEYPMLEVGSTATSYEPYVGGVPSPSPDYPQDVNVVTGEQNSLVTGKNLFSTEFSTDFTATSNNTFTLYRTNLRVTRFYFPYDLPAGTYTLSLKIASNTAPQGLNLNFFDANSQQISNISTIKATPYSRTITLPRPLNMIYAFIQTGDAANSSITVEDFQIEQGETATDFAPYQGMQSYTVDLGNTELCKIGDYQDYIYKDGDDWYLHKDTGKTIVTGDSSESWLAQANNVGYMYRLALADVGSVPAGEIANLVSDYFTPTTSGVIYNATSGGYISQLTTPGYIRFSIGDTTNKLSEFRTWLGTHNTTVYYALATTTDTKITDSTLIGQLDALAGADTYNGKTYIKVTATDPNLPVLLKVEAYKY